MLQRDICECLLIKVIKKILNKFNKRVLLNERALNLEKFNGNLSGLLSGGNLKEICEWSVHPHEEGRARG